jgi:hypothetical protein
MPMMIEEARQLLRERRAMRKGKLPPLISFVIGFGSFFIAAMFSAFYVFPFLVAFFGMKIIVAMFISLGTFVVSDVVIAELATKLIGWQLDRVEERTT